MTKITFTEEVVAEVSRTIMPRLNDPRAVESLSAVTADKGGGHSAFAVDDIAERVIFDSLLRAGFDGSIFSEESGLVAFGAGSRFLVSDPYCNSSLTFRGYREAAITLYEYGPDNRLVSGAIGDLQTGQVLTTTGQRASSSSIASPHQEQALPPFQPINISEAMIVISLLKQSRRKTLPSALIGTVGLLSTIDGAIVAARMLAGGVDAFVDLEIGQPSYEALAYHLIEAAGGTVTTPGGAIIDFTEIVSGLREGSVGRHALVAATSADLHAQILELI